MALKTCDCRLGEDMSTYWVEVDKETSETLQRLAFLAGFTWSDPCKRVECQYLDYKQLIFRSEILSSRSDDCILGANHSVNRNFSGKEVSVQEMIVKLSELIPAEPVRRDINIGGNLVEFDHDGATIKIGCQTVTKSKIAEILDILSGPIYLNGGITDSVNNVTRKEFITFHKESISVCGMEIGQEEIQEIYNCLTNA